MVNIQNSKPDVNVLIQQLNSLAEQSKIKTWCLAYSGGVDSQVLLHLLHLTKLNIMAIYIDHGLQSQSADWAKFCEQQCHQLNIPFQSINVDATPARGESPEAAARTARYTAFKKLIKKDMCLLTAQHQDDQSETILLQLMRGAGAAGLAGMPEIISFAEGWHYRPLLNINQQNILDYAQAQQLSWVEDPTNQHLNYDRNYLRHNVMPVLKQRWPALNKTLSIFSEQQAENAKLLDVLAKADLQAALLENNSLNIAALIKLENAQLRNALRFWFKSIKSPMPSRAVLQQIVQQTLSASHDTSALVSWANVEVRRFRDRLYWLKKINHDASQVFLWSASEPLLLSSIDKSLQFEKTKTENNIAYVLNESILDLSLTVRFRQGGERIQAAGRKGHHDLKSLFQEAAVPSWQRDKIPLLYADDKLVAVVGYWLADEYSAKGEGVLPVLV